MENSKKTLKEWAEDDKPREKLMNKGISALSDAELIAILISSGNIKETAVELSRRILLDQKSNLNELAKLSVIDLMQYKGIGEAKAISIVSALELGRRRNFSDLLDKPKITCSKDVYNYMCPIMCDIDHEEFWTIFLNNSNKILKRIKIGQGGITSTIVDLRLIMKTALENFATAIIICHNHPSGNLTPSSEDIKLTERIKSAGEILSIRLLDHVIITTKEYFSFTENSIVF